jgi:chemotaxis protein MotA
MDLASVIGLVAGIVVMWYSIIVGGGTVGSYIDIPSIICTMGGGLCSTIISFPLADTLRVIKVLPLAFKSPNSSAVDTIKVMVELSQKARREGLLALESAQSELKDDFLKKAMELVVDGIEAEVVKTSMQLDIDSMAVRHQNGQAYFKTMATQFPAWGMIGTLMGLVNLLKTLDDPSGIGPAMALAIITTFYGSVMANFVCNPIAAKLAGNSAEEIRLREMMMEGVLSIQSGENPRLMEHKLKTFLSPEQRHKYDSVAKTEEKAEPIGA